MRRREEQDRKEQIAKGGRWQNMETNISGGRLRREEEEEGGDEARDMTLLADADVDAMCSYEFCLAVE